MGGFEVDHGSSTLRDRFEKDWTELYRLARGLLARKGLHDHDPRDLVQHVFAVLTERAVTGRTHVDEVDNWWALYSTIARNEVHNILRRTREVPFAPGSEILEPRSVDDSSAENLARKHRQKMFDALPGDLGRLLTLRYEYDMTVADAASATGMTTEEAKRMISTFVQRLRRTERGSAPKGADAEAFQAFAREMRALRDERNGRA